MLMLLYCQKCKKALGEIGDFSAVLFDEICINYLLHHRGLDFHIKDNRLLLTVVRHLEKEGFVLSTETSKNVITVIPKGILMGQQVCIVCFEPNVHK